MKIWNSDQMTMVTGINTDGLSFLRTRLEGTSNATYDTKKTSDAMFCHQRPSQPSTHILVSNQLEVRLEAKELGRADVDAVQEGHEVEDTGVSDATPPSRHPRHETHVHLAQELLLEQRVLGSAFVCFPPTSSGAMLSNSTAYSFLSASRFLSTASLSYGVDVSNPLWSSSGAVFSPMVWWSRERGTRRGLLYPTRTSDSLLSP